MRCIRAAVFINHIIGIAVIGCYAQLKPDEIAGIEGVDLVLGAHEKFNLPYYLIHASKKGNAEIHSCEVEAADTFISSYSTGDRTRAFLKVQDGCDYSCSYCTIPMARGTSRNDSVENVVKQARQIGEQGIKEIVLTGVNIGDFRTADGDDFYTLIKALDQVEEISRFRISSIEPNLLTDDIIAFVAGSKKFVPHLHIPLQSGSDKILRLMRRRYQRSLYHSRIEKIKSLMPHCCIGADVITGFPGETEADFLESYQFISDLEVSYLHAFTYSERDHTEAINFSGTVPASERKKRNQMLRILSQKKLQRFYDLHLGEQHEVMFETENKDGMLHGYTRNYVKVKTAFDPGLVRTIAEVELQHICEDMTVF